MTANFFHVEPQASAPARLRSNNRLIDSLPEENARRLLSAAEVVRLPPEHIIYEQGGLISHVYFPTTAMCSEVVPLSESDHVIEAATLGNEGMVGAHVILGLSFSPIRTLCQVPGDLLRFAAPAFAEFTCKDQLLARLLHRYVAYNLRYSNQAVACNAVHSVEQRACRWLLMAHDRAVDDEFLLTHDFLAEMLGVRRQTVSVAAAALQAAGMIRYNRGRVAILDRHKLEDASCECYATTAAAYQSIVMANGKNH